MFTTPQKRGGATALFNSSRKTVPLTKGLFSDGVWHCNCTPRLPATHFQVRKVGRNKGRWFYTCQTNKEDGGCGFFLWDEEANVREGRAVMNNSRSEEDVSAATGQEQTPSTSTLQHTREQDGTMLTRKEIKVPTVVSQGSSDDFGDWPLSPNTERKVAQDTEVRYSSPPWPDSQPVTPRKTAKTSPFTTPQSKRKRGHDLGDTELAPDALPTPVTGGGADERRIRTASEYAYNDSDPFSTPSSLRTPSQFGIRSPSHTPTPQTRQILRPSSPLDYKLDVGSINSLDITSEVLALLKEENVYLGDETENKLRALLGKHAMKVGGIARGRDITRVALRSKDVKIAELGVRIGQLEAEREVDKRVIKSLVSEGRGRG